MANKYFRRSPLSLLQQKVALCAAYKDSSCGIENNQLIWCAKVKPTVLSKEYTVMITYKLWESPKVWVIGEALEKLDSKDFPHKFKVDKENKMVRICLYMYDEFNSHKVLANTIVPWTIEWLYFYEIWLATGEWLGGGMHPNSGIEKTDIDS